MKVRPSRPKLIGAAGLPRSGKDTLAELLIEKGYFGVSLGDIVREVARKRHADQADPISVANMTETSNWLRQNKGADFALRQALTKFKKAKSQKDYKGLLVYSVRAPVEVDYIHAHSGQLIWVEADDMVRYQRAMAHRREGKAEISFDEFKTQESLQWKPQPGIPKESQMNTGYVKKQADIFIENNGSDLEAFKKQIAQTLDP